MALLDLLDGGRGVVDGDHVVALPLEHLHDVATDLTDADDDDAMATTGGGGGARGRVRERERVGSAKGLFIWSSVCKR